MKPIELLQKELNQHLRALNKSHEMFEQFLIDKDLHEIHVINLTLLINQYKEAIEKLK